MRTLHSSPSKRGWSTFAIRWRRAGSTFSAPRWLAIILSKAQPNHAQYWVRFLKWIEINIREQFRWQQTAPGITNWCGWYPDGRRARAAIAAIRPIIYINPPPSSKSRVKRGGFNINSLRPPKFSRLRRAFLKVFLCFRWFPQKWIYIKPPFLKIWGEEEGV